MEIYKQAVLTAAGTPDGAALEKINLQAKTPLTAQQVYRFTVRLCDDQPDRDFERFDTAALPELAKLFIGKTGIMDHNWSSDRQTARIYDAGVLDRNGVRILQAEAYMLRSEKNADLIAEIEGGIRREVSIGCSMGASRCSICGCDYGVCQHRKGQVYEGQTCCAVLAQPQDAYEFSFVAVPAQRQAGVVKALGGQKDPYLALREKAALGERYLSELRRETVRLGLTLDVGLTREDLAKAMDALDVDALIRVKTAWQDRAAKRFPGAAQLGGCGDGAAAGQGEFLV